LPVKISSKNVDHGVPKLSHVPSCFLQWFVGFVDGEGNFLISPSSPRGEKAHIIFRFRIRLHIDDKPTLDYIKTVLEVGVVKIERDSCIYIVSSISDLIDIIIPVFKEYPLLSTKTLDFNDFYSAILIKLNHLGTSLSKSSYDEIVRIKRGMNSQRTTYNDLLLTSLAYNNNYLNAYWLLGFIEGEGTFGIKNNVPYFQIAQHNRNSILMLAISLYLQKKKSLLHPII